MYKVLFYEEKNGRRPIKEFLNSVQKPLRDKIGRQIKYLEVYGVSIENPSLKKISGTPLWEARILGKDSVRIVCIAVVNKKVVILHIFKKKTNRTFDRDLKLAMKRYKDLTGDI